MPALPEHLRNSMRIAWHISAWCNYGCPYCTTQVFRKRAQDGAVQPHAFDYQPVERWLELFRSFPQERIHLKITGGEPFLDRENFPRLLARLAAMERYTLRIDTNGTWDPACFQDLDKRRILLNVSYHPGEVTLKTFLGRIRAIRDAGFDVTMVNYVLAPDNLPAALETLAVLEKENFFMNLSAMIPAGAYPPPWTRSDQERELVERFNTPIDAYFRLVNPPTRGRLCFHPALSYYMLYDGSIKVHCGDPPQDVFTEGPPPLPREAVECPRDQCETCTEMYRALVDEPLVARPLSLYLLSEYVEEVQECRRRRVGNREVRNP